MLTFNKLVSWCWKSIADQPIGSTIYYIAKESCIHLKKTISFRFYPPNMKIKIERYNISHSIISCHIISRSNHTVNIRLGCHPKFTLLNKKNIYSHLYVYIHIYVYNQIVYAVPTYTCQYALQTVKVWYLKPHQSKVLHWPYWHGRIVQLFHFLGKARNLLERLKMTKA